MSSSPSSATPSMLLHSPEELRRARQRTSQPQWAAAADALRDSAERIARDEQPTIDFGTQWFDDNPGRDYLETYDQFHQFVRPITRVMTHARTLCRAGLILGNQAWIDSSHRQLMDVARHMSFHVRHHDSGMEFGRLAVLMCDVYAAHRDHITDTDDQLIRSRLAEAAEAIEWGTQHWLTQLAYMPYNNHLAFQREGLLAIALVLGQDERIEALIDGTRGFGEMLVGCTMDDGLCYESSTLYHYGTFGALACMAQMLRHHPQFGRDLFHGVFANGRCLKQMFDAPLGLLLPSGQLPTVGDCYAQRKPLWESHADVYELGYAIYGDPRYAWLLERTDRQSIGALVTGVDEFVETVPPGGRTRIWPEHGYALLTTSQSEDYWDQQSIAPTAFISIDRNGIHHHLDRFGLQIAGGGRVWLEDVESQTIASDGHGFTASIQQRFNRTTLAHNLVMIDQQSQPASDAPLHIVGYTDLPTAKTFAAADLTGTTHPDTRQIRSIAATADYIVDVYEIASAHERCCDLLLHPRADGPGDVCDAAAVPVAFGPCTSLPKAPPYDLLRDVGAAPWSGNAVHMIWRQDGGAFRASVRSVVGEASQLVRGNWPRQSDWATGGREMFMACATGCHVVFVTLYQLLRTDAEAWEIDKVTWHFNGRDHELRVSIVGGRQEQQHVFATLPAE